MAYRNHLAGRCDELSKRRLRNERVKVGFVERVKRLRFW